MILAILLGGIAGLAAGEVSRALATRRWSIGPPDALSVLLGGCGALVMAVHPLARGSLPQQLLEVGVIGFLLLIAACDVRERAVYTAIVFPGIAFVAAAAPVLGSSYGEAILGSVVGAGVFLAIHWFARLRYGPGALGDGDIPVAALLGAIVGISYILPALVLGSLIGAGIALAVGLRLGSLRARFPYAPALCAGAMAVNLLYAP